jgi:hypothetical protein
VREIGQIIRSRIRLAIRMTEPRDPFRPSSPVSPQAGVALTAQVSLLVRCSQTAYPGL